MHPALMGKERNVKTGHLTMIAEGTKQKPNPQKTDGPANVAKVPYDLYFSLHKYKFMKKLK